MKDQRASNRLVVVLSWTALLLWGALAVAPLAPPAPPAELDATAFSAAQALDHIERIAIEPRPIGTPANERARADIVAQLRLLGLEPELQTIEVPNYFSAAGETIEVVNVMARIPGTAPTSAVALMGHYDTVPSTTGANDDASAVAIMLETARAILAGPRLRNDVILLFTDGEEPAPRFGSSAFVAEHPWAGDIGFVINLEAIGSGGASLLIEMNGSGGWVIDQYAKAIPYPVAFSFLTTTVELIGGSNTDFATFRNVGISGVDLAYLHGSPIYHTMADAPERVSSRSLQHQGANALALTRHISNLDLGEPRDNSNAVFFTVGRFHVVRYPAAWALPIAVLTGVVLVVAGWRQRSWLRSLLGLGTTLGSGGRCLDSAWELARHDGHRRELRVSGRLGGADRGNRSRLGPADAATDRHGVRCHRCGRRLVGTRAARCDHGTGDELPVRVAGTGRRTDAAVAVAGRGPMVALGEMGAGVRHRTRAARSGDRHLLPVGPASTGQSRLGDSRLHRNPGRAPRAGGRAAPGLLGTPDEAPWYHRASDGDVEGVVTPAPSVPRAVP